MHQRWERRTSCASGHQGIPQHQTVEVHEPVDSVMIQEHHLYGRGQNLQMQHHVQNRRPMQEAGRVAAGGQPDHQQHPARVGEPGPARPVPNVGETHSDTGGEVPLRTVQLWWLATVRSCMSWPWTFTTGWP